MFQQKSSACVIRAMQPWPKGTTHSKLRPDWRISSRTNGPGHTPALSTRLCLLFFLQRDMPFCPKINWNFQKVLQHCHAYGFWIQRSGQTWCLCSQASCTFLDGFFFLLTSSSWEFSSTSALVSQVSGDALAAPAPWPAETNYCTTATKSDRCLKKKRKHHDVLFTILSLLCCETDFCTMVCLQVFLFFDDSHYKYASEKVQCLN